MITLSNVTIQAGAFALRDISFHVPAGGYAALMGPTGSGKTTILEAMCGLRRVERGVIRLMDQDVTDWRPARRGLGYVPQDRALFNTMTVAEHLAFALAIRRWPRPAMVARVRELADLLGLGRLLERKPRGLSGGEAQRVALGRALAFQPRILLLDEPLAALDSDTREGMYDLLQSVRRRTGVTTLHVTHDLGEAQRLADQLLLLKDGTIHESPLQRSQETNGQSIRAEPAPRGSAPDD
jgi:molybdate/tungstate transport system ATP-binding protein